MPSFLFKNSPHRTVVGGSASGQPADSPDLRLDLEGAASPFNFVGALEIFGGNQIFYGSGSAISPNWVLTAAHNLDFDDDGQADNGLSVVFHLPGFSSYTATSSFLHPDFGGFSNPNLNDDLALLYFASPLPEALYFPSFTNLKVGDIGTMAGFGRSGYGDVGYTTAVSVTQRRFGQNAIDVLLPDDEGSGRDELFEYDFDDAATTGLDGGSLGNEIESIIGPGDSGGPLLLRREDGFALAGVNTHLYGGQGRFGEEAGGVRIAPYLDWVAQTTGLPLIPEPAAAALLTGAMALLALLVRRAPRGQDRFR
ncbi:MAG: trypsin-like serine protease [Opitutales bacterium]